MPRISRQNSFRIGPVLGFGSLGPIIAMARADVTTFDAKARGFSSTLVAVLDLEDEGEELQSGRVRKCGHKRIAGCAGEAIARTQGSPHLLC